MSHPTLFLIRHGQSQANVGGVTLDNPLVPLTELGERQALVLAGLLPPAAPAIWSSPFKRSLDTAAPYCARLGVAAAVHAGLREFETIDTQHMRGTPSTAREAALARYWLEADPDGRTGPAVETFREFHERVAVVRTGWLPSLPDGTVIFGHGMWMALLFWQLWGFEQVDRLAMVHFRRFQLGFPTPNTVIYAITQLGPGKWHIEVDEPALRAVSAIELDPDQDEQRRFGVPT
jgi:broad specificity phosphatase PhoE